jgi:hypothetical protein
VDIGVVVPQGWTGEYDGWEPRRAWERTVAVARQADRLGFESVNISRYVLEERGPSRVELLAAYREVGADRVMGLLQDSAVSDESLESLAADALAAGCTLRAS